MKKIIVTGFEPFGPYAFNPTQDLAKSVDGKTIGSHEIIGLVLECTYRGAFEALRKTMDAVQPAAVISAGLASSVPGIRLETLGSNLMNGKYSDANGFEPKDLAIVEDGPEVISAHSNYLDLYDRIHAKGIPIELSADAEGFICNSLLYLTSHHINSYRLRMQNVFFHTPWTKNYRSRIELESWKKTIPEESLFSALTEIIHGVSRK